MAWKLHPFIRLAVFACIFAAGTGLGWLLWGTVHLPYKGALWQVQSMAAAAQFNPASNIVWFLFFVLPPSVLLLAFYLARGRRLYFRPSKEPLAAEDRPRRYRVPLFAAYILLAVFAALLVPTFQTGKGLDSFHEGETLGTATCYMHGQTPYKDTIILHGMYEDPLRSVLAFKLFGRSIGAVRTLKSIVKVATFVLLACLFLVLLRGNYLYSTVALLLTTALNKVFVYAESNALLMVIARDVSTLSFLLAALALHRSVSHLPVRRGAVFVWGFACSLIAFTALGQSVDRGMYLIISWAALLGLLYIAAPERAPVRRPLHLSSLLGIVTADVLIAIPLRGDFRHFFEYVFQILPKYMDLMSGFPADIRLAPFFWANVLIAFNIFWICLTFLRTWNSLGEGIISAVREFVRREFAAVLLLVMSLIFMKSALGRPDSEHIAYSIMLSVVLFLYILFSRYIPRWGGWPSAALKLLAAAFIICFIAVSIREVPPKQILASDFPLGVRDEEYLPPDYLLTLSFLRDNIHSGDEFYTMTSEGIWYYYLDVPSPTRFPILYYATPDFYQREIVQDLAKKKVKFILYTNARPCNRFDGIPNEERFPILTDWVLQNYAFLVMIGSQQIWVRKDLLK